MDIFELIGSILARKRIRLLEARLAEAEADIADLLAQLAYDRDIASPADIVKESAFSLIQDGIAIDLKQLNMPFTKSPKIIPIFSIPKTGSMDGIFDYGNSQLYIEPADIVNHKIMVDWIAQQWIDSQGLQTVDAVYRIMVDAADDPKDFTKPDKWYAIHRLVEVGADAQGRFFWFAGVHNPDRDPFPARDHNILFLSIGTIY